MDELKDMFKSLLKGGKKSTFQGTGHRLGNDAAAQPGARKAGDTSAMANPSKQQDHNARPQQLVPHKPVTSSSGPNLQQHSSSAGAARVDPRQELKPATEFSPFTAVIGGGAARTSNNMNPAGLATGSQQDTGGSSSSTPGSGRRLGSSAAQQPAPPPVARAAVSSAVLEEQQHCLALIASQQSAAVSSMQVLHKLLSNLYTSPQEAKFRQLRLGPAPPPKIQAAVLDVPAALDFLKACGFEVHADAPDSPEPGTWAYFLDDAQLSHVESGLSQLQLAMQSAQQQHKQQQQTGTQPPGQSQAQAAAQGASAAAHGSSSPVALPATIKAAAPTAATAAAPAAGAQAPQVSRNTLVLLPAAPDADVPEWFFERTAAEVKSEFMSLLRQRQAKQLVASKAWKDLKLGASSSSSSKRPTAITLRVRFPEGVCLQGCFAVREPVSSVFDWVTSSLRHPGLTFELITPSRTPLSPSGPVGAADLAGAVLNFRGLGHTVRGYLVNQSGAQLPFLSDALLAQAQAD